MTLGELSAEALLRLQRKAAKSYRRRVDRIETSYIRNEQLARALRRTSVSQIAARMREGKTPYLTEGLADLNHTTAYIKQHYPESVVETHRQAEAITRHEITIFEHTFNFSEKIDWHADIETGVRWQLEHYTQVPLVKGKLSDVRAVWELNRLHHLVTLGRAYAFTKDERYAEEFVAQVISWCEANPPCFGVNWTVAMEAAIRAVNIIAALQLFIASPKITDAVIELILKTLLAHGRFIRANLENSYRLSSNHYLSDLLGLFVIGATQPHFRESPVWLKFSTAELIKEIPKQVLADGVSFESSIGYHRLALEIFTLFFTLSNALNITLPDEISRRLEAMFDFVRAYLKPDGTAPILGDADDGRIVKFKERAAIDHSYLTSIAAVLFNQQRFKSIKLIDEEAVWWFSEAGIKTFENLPVTNQPPLSQAFNEAQIFIQRQDSFYSIIDCGDNGIGGRGSHAHSDALAIELCAFGQTFLRDTGTYVYTASKRWRHLFRSTAYHNTVRIDRQEITEINREQPFALGTNVLPKINLWQSDAERDILDAEHSGYTRLSSPVTHRRIFTFEKSEGFWILEDLFTGEGNHLFEFFFNFDAGLKISLAEQNQVIALGKSAALVLAPVSNLPVERKITMRSVSLSHRTRRPSFGIMYRLCANVPCRSVMLLIPFHLGDEAHVESISSRYTQVGLND